MPKFTYVSRNQGGEKITAVAEAESRLDLIAQLKGRGLFVVDVKEIAIQRSKSVKNAVFTLKDLLQMELTVRKVSVEEQAIFWRQLATMVEAGLPVIDALESIAEETEHASFKKTLNQITADLWEGFSLSQGLNRHPKTFPAMITALIAAAEESGSLPEVAAQVATFLENRDRLIRKVRSALTYPVFLAGFFVCVLAVSTFWIIPQFQTIYEGFKADLPPLTKLVFALNQFFLRHFLWVAGAFTAGLTALIVWLRRPSGRKALDQFILRLPVFGKIVNLAGIARFCRSLSVLLYGGIAINRALEMAEQTSGNSVIASAVKRVREDILKGSKIAASLRKEKIFPKMTVRMVSAGEETGNISSLLNKAADFYEARVDAVLSTINALIEPIIIIFIGGFVLVFILALYMPIFTLAMNMH